MKILIPVDFSEGSSNAVQYASKMAVKLGAELILLHVVSLNSSPHASLFKVRDIEDAMVDISKKDFLQILHDLKVANSKLRASYKIIKGYPLADMVENFAVQSDIDLIILGSKGAGGLGKILMGSNAAAIIGKSSILVITVPEGARFKGIRQIVYASDLHNVDKEIKSILPLARTFNAFIHILHIVQPDSKIKVNKVKMIEGLVARFNYPKIKLHISMHDELIAGIEECIQVLKGDLLVMFTHNPTFFEKLFHKALTREISFHCMIPLLSMKKTTKKRSKSVKSVNHSVK